MFKRQSINNNPAQFIKFRSGGTDFDAGLSLAYPELQNTPAGETPVLLFMTDGGCHNGENWIKKIQTDLAPKGIQIYIIGFGAGCSVKKLENMALLSGGKFVHGKNGINLKSEFETISISLSTKTMSL